MTEATAPVDMRGLHIALVGPLPPPPGGMANQTAQLADLLSAAGATVELVQTNPAWRPAWAAGWRGVRAALRLLPYLWRLWRAAGRAQLLHVMANSGWSWHLHAAPAIWIGWLRGKGVLVNYRGGEAATFLSRRASLIGFSVRRADAIVVPSAFLGRVFEGYGIHTRIVPNIVNLERFQPAPTRSDGANILVARHLEALYDNASALHAFAKLRRSLPHAQLIICGEGPELAKLQALAQELQLSCAVRFSGKISNAAMADLYRQADAVLNPSLADNMPISVLEAWASGVPVVSTNVGGIPDLIRDGVDGVLVHPGDTGAMAQALLRLLNDRGYARHLAGNGRRNTRRYSWERVAPLWLAQYRQVTRRPPRFGYTALVSRVLFPLHEWLKGHQSRKRRMQLEASQWWPRERIAKHQLQRLRAFLAHVSEHVPYYRRLYRDMGFDPATVREVSDLQRLPVLRKQDINDHREDFISDCARPMQRMTTGGSSGEPLIFFLSKERISHDIAAKWRATRWWSVDIGDREALVWGSPIELGLQDAWRACRDHVLRTELLPAFDLSPTRLDKYLARLRRLRPATLFGYPSAMSLLAEHAQKRGVPLDTLGVRVVFSTAERLYDNQRALLSRVFGAPVANGYGGRDSGFIAHECPEGGMHISAEDIIVEILGPDGAPVPDGVSGAIVITHLASADFPFIRYATGDMGAIDPRPCVCGRGLPLLKQVEGRATDFVVARDGTIMHGLALIYILRDLPGISAFKIIQESVDCTRVLLVCASGLPPSLRVSIVAQFRARLGDSVDVAIEEVTAIPAEASGKYRYVVSKVIRT